MPVPQTGIFAVGTPAHAYLEFDLLPGADRAALVGAVAGLPVPHTSMGGVNLVVGFRPELWAAVAPGEMPADAASFATVDGVGGYSMPATQHDAWLWIAGPSRDVVFDVGRGAVDGLVGLARLADETTGWTYRGHRDLTGFEDGTENPTLLEAPTAALVPDGIPGGASSVVLVQRWRHDTAAWNALGTKAQEMVIGRTLDGSLELAEDVMPPDSHVARTALEDDGEELAIFRRNSPYGDLREHGTYFVGFSAEQRRLALMLDSMAGVGDGLRCALTRYAEALTGAYYAVPSVDALARFAPAVDE